MNNETKSRKPIGGGLGAPAIAPHIKIIITVMKVMQKNQLLRAIRALSAIRIGVAIERSAGGAQAARAVYAIPALAGSWRHVGGGMLQLPLWDFPVDWVKAARPDFIKPGTRVVNNLRLGQALNGEMRIGATDDMVAVTMSDSVTH